VNAAIHDTDLLVEAVTVTAYAPTVGRDVDPDHDLDVDPNGLDGHGHVDLGLLAPGDNVIALVVDLRDAADVRVVVKFNWNNTNEFLTATGRLLQMGGPMQMEFDVYYRDWDNVIVRMGRLDSGNPAYLRVETDGPCVTVWLDPQGLVTLNLQANHLIARM
jgi:hypothetical protein